MSESLMSISGLAISTAPASNAVINSCRRFSNASMRSAAVLTNSHALSDTSGSNKNWLRGSRNLSVNLLIASAPSFPFVLGEGQTGLLHARHVIHRAVAPATRQKPRASGAKSGNLIVNLRRERARNHDAPARNNLWKRQAFLLHVTILLL